LAGDECRPADGVCDVAEVCSGTSADCPDNGFLAGDECRPADGVCDVAEVCSGTSTDCPDDGFLAGGECRPVNGDCDVAEECTGDSADCPADIYLPESTECRPSTDACDPAEVCTGNSAECPEDVAATCTLCGNKFYDANANAAWDDDDEVGVKAWKITMIGADNVAVSAETDDVGAYSFDSLQAGDYTVCEEYPIQDNWMQTAPLEGCYTVLVPTTHGLCMYDFGNLCLGEGGGHTPGYWSNKNGHHNFLGDDDGVSSLALLTSLNLRTAIGGDFDPLSYGEFDTWLLDSTAVNMAYKLSSHLAAMALNVSIGYVDGAALVYAPGAIDVSSLGFITIFDLMAEADGELGLHGNTPNGSLYRSYQEALMDALAAANNNQNYVQSEACAFGFENEVPESDGSALSSGSDTNEESLFVTLEDQQISDTSAGGCSAGGTSSSWGGMLMMALALAFTRRRRNT
jgi:MYXO-CTERM domain-containing protein